MHQLKVSTVDYTPGAVCHPSNIFDLYFVLLFNIPKVYLFYHHTLLCCKDIPVSYPILITFCSKKVATLKYFIILFGVCNLFNSAMRMDEFRLTYVRLCKENHTEPQDVVVEKLKR